MPEVVKSLEEVASPIILVRSSSGKVHIVNDSVPDSPFRGRRYRRMMCGVPGLVSESNTVEVFSLAGTAGSWYRDQCPKCVKKFRGLNG